MRATTQVVMTMIFLIISIGAILSMYFVMDYLYQRTVKTEIGEEFTSDCINECETGKNCDPDEKYPDRMYFCGYFDDDTCLDKNPCDCKTCKDNVCGDLRNTKCTWGKVIDWTGEGNWNYDVEKNQPGNGAK